MVNQRRADLLKVETKNTCEHCWCHKLYRAHAWGLITYTLSFTETVVENMVHVRNSFMEPADNEVRTKVLFLCLGKVDLQCTVEFRQSILFELSS